MNIVNALFSVARTISDGGNLDDINKLEERAKSEVLTYHTEQKGIKGLIAKSRESWIFNLALIFAVPLVSAWFINLKNEIYTKSQISPQDLVDDDFEDDNWEE
jgi:hypothetical protein